MPSSAQAALQDRLVEITHYDEHDQVLAVTQGYRWSSELVLTPNRLPNAARWAFRDAAGRPVSFRAGQAIETEHFGFQPVEASGADTVLEPPALEAALVSLTALRLENGTVRAEPIAVTFTEADAPAPLAERPPWLVAELDARPAAFALPLDAGWALVGYKRLDEQNFAHLWRALQQCKSLEERRALFREADRLLRGEYLRAFMQVLEKRTEGQLEAVVTQVTELLAANPEWPWLHEHIADALHELGRHAEAIAHIGQVLGPEVTDEREWRIYAECLADLGRPAEAVPVFERLIAFGDAPLSLRRRYAKTLSAAGRTGEAHAVLSQCLAEAPFDPGLLLEAVHAAPDPATTRGYVERLVALRPDDGAAWHYLALSRFQADDESGAREAALVAVQKGIESPAVWSGLGNLFLQLNHFDRALTCFQEAYWLDPESPVAQADVALLLAYLERYAEAVPLAEAALAAAPGTPEALCALGLADFKAGRHDLARERLATAVHANEYLLRFCSPYLQSLVDDPEEKLRLADAALAFHLEPVWRESGLYYLKAVALARLERFTDAYAAVVRACEISPLEEFAARLKAKLAVNALPVGEDIDIMRRYLRSFSNEEGRLEIEDALFTLLEVERRLASEPPLDRVRTLLRLECDLAARRELDAVLAADASNARALELRGILRLKRDDRAGGVADLAAALRLAPGEFREVYALQHAYVKAGAREEAEQLAAAVDAAENPLGSFIAHTMLKAAQGDTAGAWDDLSQARASMPPHADVLELIGTLAETLDDHETAGRAWMGKIALNPDDAEAYAGLGRALALLGRADEAGLAMRAALARNASCADAWYGVGMLAKDAGRDDEAVAAFRHVLKLEPFNLGAMYSLAQALMNDDEYLADAESALRRLTALAPEFPDGQRLLAEVLIMQGNVSEASAVLQACTERGEASAWYRMTKARLLMHHEAYGEALQDLDACMTEGVATRWARFSRIRCLAKLGREDDERVALDAYLERWPNDHDALTERGRLALQAGDHAAAQAFLERAIVAKPRAEFAYRLLAHAYRETGAFDHEEALLRRALTQVTTSELFMQLGNTLNRQGRSDEAIALLDQGLSVFSDDAMLLAMTGALYRKKGDGEKALRHLERAYRLMPDEKDIRWEIMQAWRRTGQASRALAEAQKWAAQNADDTLALSSLSSLHDEAGDLQAAVSYARRAHEAAPDDAEHLRSLALCLHKAGDDEQAAALFLRLTEREPTGADYFYLGKIRLQANQPGEAIVWLQRAIELRPDEPIIWGMLAWALARADRKAEAEKVLEKLEQIDPREAARARRAIAG